MDFKIIGKGPDFHVFSIHQTGADDKSPLQIISADRLAELENIEAEAMKSRVKPADAHSMISADDGDSFTQKSAETRMNTDPGTGL